jgi:V/A-type H+-transporting ATPase subunit K
MIFDATSLATLGGALALIGGLVGSSIGIAKAASAGTATLAEDSGQFILILIITAVVPNVETAASGMAVLGIGLIGFLAELFSAIYQGSVCASGISLLPKTKGRIFTSSMMLAVFVELLGVLGLVFSIMALTMLGLM